MRIIFLTQNDPLYVLPFFNEFFRKDLGTILVAGIFSCKIMGDRRRLKLLHDLRCLYGTVGLSRLLLRSAAYKALAILPANKAWKRFYSVAQLCRSLDIEHAVIGDPNHKECRERIAALTPDLLVSIACPYILKDQLLGLPPLGCINMHHAPLPRYKGMMPTFWQMYHGEKQVGITIHKMAARIDEGVAMLQEHLPIHDKESLDSLIRRTKRHGANCMLAVLQQIARQSQMTFSLDGRHGSYFTFPTPAEMKEFRRRGLRAI
jgi:methionyl-tRNA formyltransferase